ncbi:GroES-like protein [Trametes meyenii]|nr:GroES-like protein [Trametes meyenii]
MTIPTHQKSLQLLSKLGPFSIQQTKVPHPGPNDLLVRVEAAGLIPLDWKIQAFGLLIEKYPATLGSDGAGVVVSVGANVSDFKIGDRVAVANVLDDSASGTYQQYALSSAALATKLPDSLSFDEAATFPGNLHTAAVTLYNKHEDATSLKLTAPWEAGGRNAYANQPMVVLGGAASVGQYVIQFLKLSGFSPIITTASPRNEELVKSLGATHVFDRSLPASTLSAEILKLAGGPLPFVYDAVSVQDTQNLAYDLVAPGGHILLLLPENVDAAKKTDGRDVKFSLSSPWLAFPYNYEFGKVFVKEFEKLLADGSFKPNTPEVLPGGLNAVVEGLERLKANAVSAKKLIVHPQETA